MRRWEVLAFCGCVNGRTSSFGASKDDDGRGLNRKDVGCGGLVLIQSTLTQLRKGHKASIFILGPVRRAP